MRNKANSKNIVIAVIISIIIAVVFLSIGSKKETLWLDEIYTYGLSNNDIFTIFDESTRTYTGAEIIRDYMTVEDGHAFDFKMVFENQAKDVHPPLYYMFVHFFSSFRPGTFSMLYALIPNIIFAVIVYWQMVWMFGKFCKNKKLSLLFSGLFIFTMCFTNTVMLFRMYALLTVMTNLLVILHLKYKPLAEKDKKFYIYLFCIILCGVLTQYYFSIIAGIMCFIYALQLIFYKKIKELIMYVISGGLGLVASVVIFPSMIYHIFFGYRGKEAFESFASSSLINSAKTMFGILNRQQFANMAVVITAVVFVLWVVLCRKDKQINNDIIYILLNITLPVVMFVCVVAKVAPYQTDRYVMNIAGLMYISVFGVLLLVLKDVNKKFNIIAIAAAILILVGSYKGGVPYLNQSSVNAKIQEVKDIPCVYVYDTSAYKCVDHYMQLGMYDNVTLLASWDAEFVDSWQYVESQQLVVYYDMLADDSSILDRIIENNPNIDGYSLLYKAGDVPVYILN